MMPENERLRSILYLHEIEKSLVQADIELYLREELASIAPADEDITELAEHAGNLFIYAATAVRYIRPVGKRLNSKARLKTILAVSAESSKALSAIDQLYTAILKGAIEDEDLNSEEKDQMRLVLQTAICACEPMPIHILSMLSGLDEKDDAIAALEPLRSVLHVSEHSELVTTLHASFPDFMFNPARSDTFYCDKAVHNQLLAEQCLNIMKAQLRFNICSIQSSFFPNDQIPELGKRINENISNELFYTCRFWVDHLNETNPADALLFLTHEFLSQRLLFWMEVMSLKKCMVTGMISIAKLNTWLTKTPLNTNTKLLELASDAEGFIANYALSPASAYTPHIYLSALPLTSLSSSVRLQYLPDFSGLIEASGTILERMEKAALGFWASIRQVRSAFSPNGKWIVQGDETGEISVRNAYDGKYIVQPFKAHKKTITALGISSDSMQIASGSNDRTLFIWNARDGSPVCGPFKGHNGRVTSVAFSPDATYLASGSDDRTVGIWSAYNVAVPMRSFTGHTEGVKSVAFSPDGSRVVSGSSDRTIILWHLSSGAALLTFGGLTGAITSVHWQSTPDGSYIISDSGDNSLCIWSVSNRSPPRQVPNAHSRSITSIAVSPDGSRIISGSQDCTVRVWDTHTCEPIAGPFQGHTDSVRAVGFSGDGTHIMSASDDKTVRVWNVRAQVPQTEKDSKYRTRHGMKLVSSHSQTHVALYDGTKTTFHVWDLDTMRHVAIPTTASVKLLQFSPDGARIYSLHTPSTICTWDAQTGKLIEGPHRFTGLEKWDSVACSVDGTRVVACQGNKAELWHVRSNQSIALCKISSVKKGVCAIFSQDGSRFVTSGYCDDMILSDVWDGNSRARVAGPFLLQAFGLSPDGTHLGGWPKPGDWSSQLINVTTGEMVAMPEMYNGMFSPDGLDVVGQAGCTIHVWNARNQTATSFDIPPMTCGSYSFNLLGWSSDGSLLLSLRHYGERDGFHIWRTHIDHHPFAMSSDGWVLDDHKRPLVWVSTEIRQDFPLCNGVIVSDGDDVVQSVDYTNRRVGDDWSQCYILDPLNTRTDV